MQEGSWWKYDSMGGHYRRSVSSGCMVWWIGKCGSLSGESFEGHSMAKRQACCDEERILVSKGWSKLPRYRTMLVTFAVESSLARNTQHHRPPYSPNLPPLDYSFWIKCMQYVKKKKPMNICDLRRRVNRFAENIDEKALRKMVRHNRKRAALLLIH